MTNINDNKVIKELEEKLPRTKEGYLDLSGMSAEEIQTIYKKHGFSDFISPEKKCQSKILNKEIPEQ